MLGERPVGEVELPIVTLPIAVIAGIPAAARAIASDEKTDRF